MFLAGSLYLRQMPGLPRPWGWPRRIQFAALCRISWQLGVSQNVSDRPGRILRRLRHGSASLRWRRASGCVFLSHSNTVRGQVPLPSMQWFDRQGLAVYALRDWMG